MHFVYFGRHAVIFRGSNTTETSFRMITSSIRNIAWGTSRTRHSLNFLRARGRRNLDRPNWISCPVTVRYARSWTCVMGGAQEIAYLIHPMANGGLTACVQATNASLPTADLSLRRLPPYGDSSLCRDKCHWFGPLIHRLIQKRVATILAHAAAAGSTRNAA